jgi:hypothetical protein
MADVKRYELFGTFSRMEGCSEGDWVTDTDYAALLKVAEELVKALEGMVEYFGVGPQGCNCISNDCPIRIAKVALANAAKLAPTRTGGSGCEKDDRDDSKKGVLAKTKWFKKLTNEQATEIRQLQTSGTKVKDLAGRYGVSLSTIYQIVHRYTHTEASNGN